MANPNSQTSQEPPFRGYARAMTSPEGLHGPQQTVFYFETNPLSTAAFITEQINAHPDAIIITPRQIQGSSHQYAAISTAQHDCAVITQRLLAPIDRRMENRELIQDSLSAYTSVIAQLPTGIPVEQAIQASITRLQVTPEPHPVSVVRQIALLTALQGHPDRQQQALGATSDYIEHYNAAIAASALASAMQERTQKGGNAPIVLIFPAASPRVGSNGTGNTLRIVPIGDAIIEDTRVYAENLQLPRAQGTLRTSRDQFLTLVQAEGIPLMQQAVAAVAQNSVNAEVNDDQEQAAARPNQVPATQERTGFIGFVTALWNGNFTIGHDPNQPVPPVTGASGAVEHTGVLHGQKRSILSRLTAHASHRLAGDAEVITTGAIGLNSLTTVKRGTPLGDLSFQLVVDKNRAEFKGPVITFSWHTSPRQDVWTQIRHIQNTVKEANNVTILRRDLLTMAAAAIYTSLDKPKQGEQDTRMQQTLTILWESAHKQARTNDPKERWIGITRQQFDRLAPAIERFVRQDSHIVGDAAKLFNDLTRIADSNYFLKLLEQAQKTSDKEVIVINPPNAYKDALEIVRKFASAGGYAIPTIPMDALQLVVSAIPAPERADTMLPPNMQALGALRWERLLLQAGNEYPELVQGEALAIRSVVNTAVTMGDTLGGIGIQVGHYRIPVRLGVDTLLLLGKWAHVDFTPDVDLKTFFYRTELPSAAIELFVLISQLVQGPPILYYASVFPPYFTPAFMQREADKDRIEAVLEWISRATASEIAELSHDSLLPRALAKFGVRGINTY